MQIIVYKKAELILGFFVFSYYAPRFETISPIISNLPKMMGLTFV